MSSWSTSVANHRIFVAYHCIQVPYPIGVHLPSASKWTLSVRAGQRDRGIFRAVPHPATLQRSEAPPRARRRLFRRECRRPSQAMLPQAIREPSMTCNPTTPPIPSPLPPPLYSALPAAKVAFSLPPLFALPTAERLPFPFSALPLLHNSSWAVLPSPLSPHNSKLLECPLPQAADIKKLSKVAQRDLLKSWRQE